MVAFAFAVRGSLGQPMSHNFFAFGTLMYPEIVVGLLDRLPEMSDATLNGFRRARINQPGRSARGPAAVPSLKDRIEGKILFNLSERETALFDQFENAAGGYERIVAVAQTPTSVVPVSLYIAGNDLRQCLTEEDWSEEEFRAQHFDYYVTERVPALREKWRREGLFGL